jgi:thiol-disulfide isomerase/thioredoxin
MEVKEMKLTRKLGCIILATALVACGTERRSPVSRAPRESPVDAGTQEDAADPPVAINCPNRDNSIGFGIGDTFPSVRYPNAEWEGVSIKSLCGSKAILVVSATEWCGACMVEFDYLAMVAADWKDRGGEVYYTLFENYARQPPAKETLASLEEYMLQTYGDVPFRVLSDSSGSLPRALGGGVSLPIAWMLNEEMIVVSFSEGTNGPMVTGWMESLLN